ncbi:MAG: hypothetical protein ACC726_06480, partial [Chloroflexota bacterium]
MTEPHAAHRSDSRPDFEPFTIQPAPVTGFSYDRGLGAELADERLDGAAAIDLLDDMLAIRELEEMIVRLRSGG